MTAKKNSSGTNLGFEDKHLADNIFWVPPEARWSYLQKNAKHLEIGTLVDIPLPFKWLVE